jgi:choice-of-anchor I-like protein
MLLHLPLVLLLAQEKSPTLEFVAVLTTSAPGAEIVSVQKSTARALLTHSQKGLVEVFDLANPAAPRSLRVLDLGLEKGEELTSLSFAPKGEWFLAVLKAGPEFAPGRAVLHGLDGKRLASFPTGVGPDCVAISPSGTQALIANEAEGFDSDSNVLVSAPGSLTHILFATDLAASKVTQIAFPQAVTAPTDERTLERDVDDQMVDVPLLATPDYVEPEVVAFLPDEARALVTLQENNMVAVIDLAGGKVERLIALGNTTHAADLVSNDKFAETGPLLARRESDGIALVPGGRMFVTADEGDTGPSLEKTAPGKPVGGGRTLSVFDLASGACLGDTGAELDRLAAAAGLYPDKRSGKKGSEPEMVLCFERGGRPFAAVTLERAGALALVDLSDPAKPAVVAVVKTGGEPLKDEPEGLAYFRDPASGADYLYVANEGTGTLGVLRVLR